MVDENPTANRLKRIIEGLGIVDTYLPSERIDQDADPDTWHYTHSDARGVRDGTHYPKHRFEFMHSTDSGSWHCATIAVSFFSHNTDFDFENGVVYDPYIDVTVYDLKPVADRVRKNDAKAISKESFLVADGAVTSGDILDAVSDAQDYVVDRAEVLGSDRRCDIRDEVDRRWNPETESFIDPGETGQQVLTGF
jgi:hypothetical protein